MGAEELVGRVEGRSSKLERHLVKQLVAEKESPARHGTSRLLAAEEAINRELTALEEESLSTGSGGGLGY